MFALRFLGSLTLWQFVSLGLAVLYGVQHFELVVARHSAAKWHHQYDVLNKAQKDAKTKNEADVKRIKAEQQRITDNVSKDYERDLAGLRRELSLRLHTPSGPSVAPVPNISDTSPRIDEKATMCIPASTILYAAETELQLDNLITWIENQEGANRDAPNRPSEKRLSGHLLFNQSRPFEE